MKCPLCPVEPIVNNAGKSITGDNSPDTPTKIYDRINFVCRNPQCPNFGKVIGEELILSFDSSAPQPDISERQVLIRDIDGEKEIQ